VAGGDLAGRHRHAASVDARVFPGKPPDATEFARTVFTHSLEMTVVSRMAGRFGLAARYDQVRENPPPSEKALIENERVWLALSSDGAGGASTSSRM